MKITEVNIRLAMGRERIDDVLTLYKLKTKVRREVEESGSVDKDSKFPLSIGLVYATNRGNVWVLNMKYHCYEEWESDNESYIWEFQVYTNVETREIYAVRPFKLPSGKIVCCIFSPSYFAEYDNLVSFQKNDIYSVLGTLLNMLDMENLVESDGMLYIPSKDMFMEGRPLDIPKNAFLFDKQIFYKKMDVGVDVPSRVCKEMLFRSMKFTLEWRIKEGIKYIPVAFFKNYVKCFVGFELFMELY